MRAPSDRVSSIEIARFRCWQPRAPSVRTSRVRLPAIIAAMERASYTAIGASLMRALHTRCDLSPLIDDAWGDRLVGDDEREALSNAAAALLPPDERQQLQGLGVEERLTRSLHAHPSYATVIIRQRFIEDVLAHAVTRGICQYVIVGAGLDSYALRRPADARDLRVFELDHPATQELKLRRLASHGLTELVNVHYVAADLRQEGLDHALERVPFDRTQPAFFSWLGVTPYLTRDTNLTTLRAIASSGAAGSEVVFNYLDQRSFDSSASDQPSPLRAFFASLGEPWVSGFYPFQLAEDLDAVGLRLVENLGQHELGDRYCAGRNDGLQPFADEYLARAVAR